MSPAGFDGRARLASGSKPTASTASYRVTVASGALRLGPASTHGVVVDVPLARVTASPLGRGGSVVVQIDESPLLLDFSDHADSDEPATPGARALRVVAKGRGRHRRDRFLRALNAAPS